jgi:hypothetical protein
MLRDGRLSEAERAELRQLAGPVVDVLETAVDSRLSASFLSNRCPPAI